MPGMHHGHILDLSDLLCSLRGQCQTCGAVRASVTELTLLEHCREGWVNKHPITV